MTFLKSLGYCLVLLLASTQALVAETGTPRTLGMIVTYPERGNYESALHQAKDAGVSRVPLTFFWDALEPAPRVYEDQVLAIASLYFPAMGLPIDIAISPISGSRLVMPDDLAGRPFDDPVVITRYLDLLEHVLGVLAETEVGVLLIGIEVDAYLGDDSAAWGAYATFIGEAARLVHSMRPEIQIAVQSSTYSRFDRPDDWAPIDAVSDLIATSYYPLDGLRVRDPSVVEDDFDALTALYPDRTIHIVEAGYPSSRRNGSSLDQQAAFIHELFEAWDDHAGQIRSITLATQHDYPPGSIDRLQLFYGDLRPAYGTFVGSIGLRHWHDDGPPKPAWDALIQETTDRGWTP